MRPASSLLLVACCVVTPSLLAAPRHAELLREATAAARAGDHAAAVTKLEAAVHLRPDYPRIQLNLARLYATLGRPDDALTALQRLADMGLQLNLAADPGLAALKDLPRFTSLATRLTAGPAAVIPADQAAFALTGATGIIESCLVDPETQAWYFGDVRNRCVWRRDPRSGALLKFTSDDDALDGVFRIALSADRRTLWASTATVGAMTGPDAEDGKRTALVAIDPATGRVRARYAVPADGRPHLLGDFAIAADGSLYATDSLSPIIWRLPAGGTALEPWLESDEFLSLQGIAFASDGRSLYVADYANGIWRIDPVAKTIALLTAPANATFFGIDGLQPVTGGLIAVQNGISPQRILRIEPAADGPSPARIIAAGDPAMTDLALGQVFNGRFHFIGNSGWALFDAPPSAPPAARTVTILAIPID
jgi:sugar lactone lactonase YvrE